MKARLQFVPPGGGETDYVMDAEFPELPKAGDYITIRFGEEQGTRDFIVKRTWWFLKHRGGDDDSAEVAEANVECYFAEGHNSTEDHKNACRYNINKGRNDHNSENGKVLQFDSSVY